MRKIRTEDAAVVQFETDRGAMGSVVVSQISAGHKNRLWLEVDAAREALAFSQENPETLWSGRQESVTLVQRGGSTMAPAAARLSRLPAGHPQGYADCFDSFVADVYEAIRDTAAPDGMPVFGDGLRSAHIIAAVLESAATREWVSVAMEPVVEAAAD
jgi:predicted dehydrogenase